MIILHAGVSTDRLLLWGETPGGVNARPSRRQGRKPKILRPELFPFDAGIKGLCSAVRCAGVNVSTRKARAQPMTAWLPMVANTQVPSSPLIAEPPEPRTKTRLAPWTVTTLPITLHETLDILCACVGKRTLAPGVVVGHDVSFWVMAMRFAGSLVARQQFLPGLTEKDGKYRALWEPVFAGADAERLVDIGKGTVSAMVQGSRSRPYKVKIKVKTLSRADRTKLAKCFSHQPIFVAKLLAGEMPQDIEKAFQDTGLSLFPSRIKDLETGCSCPDWSNPCKHIAAVYYLLGEDLLGEVRIPPVSAALPKRLGNFSFWRSEEMFMEAMEQIYHLASRLGMDLFLGERGTKI